MKLSALIATAAFVPIGSLNAATTISIDAGNNGWTGWTQVLTSGNSSQNGTFLGTAANGSDITTTGSFGSVSWSLYANSGQTASRYYDLDSSLTVGQTLGLNMDNPGIQNGGVVGISLQNNSGTNRFEFYYVGGDSVNSYKINDSSGQENVTLNPGPNFPWTSSGFSISFTQLAANNYSFAINGNNITNSGLGLDASDISRVRIFNFNAGGSQDAHFNSLSVVPEPGAAALGLVGAALLLRRRR